MLSSFNEECCINPGVCLDITPWFFLPVFVLHEIADKIWYNDHDPIK